MNNQSPSWKRAYRIRSGVKAKRDDIPTTGHLVKASCEVFLAKRGLTTDVNWNQKRTGAQPKIKE